MRDINLFKKNKNKQISKLNFYDVLDSYNEIKTSTHKPITPCTAEQAFNYVNSLNPLNNLELQLENLIWHNISQALEDENFNTKICLYPNPYMTVKDQRLPILQKIPFDDVLVSVEKVVKKFKNAYDYDTHICCDNLTNVKYIRENYKGYDKITIVISWYCKEE